MEHICALAPVDNKYWLKPDGLYTWSINALSVKSVACLSIYICKSTSTSTAGAHTHVHTAYRQHNDSVQCIHNSLKMITENGHSAVILVYTLTVRRLWALSAILSAIISTLSSRTPADFAHFASLVLACLFPTCGEAHRSRRGGILTRHTCPRFIGYWPMQPGLSWTVR